VEDPRIHLSSAKEIGGGGIEPIPSDPIIPQGQGRHLTVIRAHMLKQI